MRLQPIDKVDYKVSCTNCKNGVRLGTLGDSKKKFVSCKKNVGTFPVSSRFQSCKYYEPKRG